MDFGYQNTQGFIRQVWSKRQAGNSSYSLRAFARDLKVSPSYLSEVYNGKKSLTLKTGLSFAKKLKLSLEETEYLCQLIQIEKSKDLTLKEAFLNRLKQSGIGVTRDLSVDHFRMIADWYHFAILEMTELDGGVNAIDICERLGLSRPIVDAAIERLKNLELIEETKNKKLRKTETNLHVGSRDSNAALKSHHKQMLEKAIESLETQTPQERYNGSQNFAIDPELLPRAEKAISQFRAEMVNLFNQSKNKKEVYHLDIQLFRLTNRRKK